MPSISLPVATIAAAGIGAAGSLAAGSLSAGAAKSAASAQVAAANQASATTLGMFNATQANLQPYIQTGNAAQFTQNVGLGIAGYGQDAGLPGWGYGSLTAPFQPTQAQLAQTPGYQFTLGQGEQAVQNSFAAQGLGSSGAALKGAANYAEGLASTTYQQQFQNYWNQIGNVYNELGGQSTIGANAAGGLATQSTANAANLAGLTTGAGAASAAGTVGATNALTSGLSGLTNSASSGLLLNALLNNQGQYQTLPQAQNPEYGGAAAAGGLT